MTEQCLHLAVRDVTLSAGISASAGWFLPHQLALSFGCVELSGFSRVFRNGIYRFIVHLSDEFEMIALLKCSLYIF
jgi:hypothetical protein